MPCLFATTTNEAPVRIRIRSAIGLMIRSGCGMANAVRISGIWATVRAIASDCLPDSRSS